MFVLLSLSALVGVLIYVYLTWSYGYWAKRNVPHLKPKPLFGNLPNGILQKRNVYYDFERIYK